MAGWTYLYFAVIGMLGAVCIAAWVRMIFSIGKEPDLTTIRNTSKTEVHPEWLFGGNPKAVERQEKEGQDQLVNSDQLPVGGSGKELLEARGVKFGPALQSDPLFCLAELPAGWVKRATNHPMWSELVDAEGKIVADIFYKAAFYDRDAFFRARVDVAAE